MLSLEQCMDIKLLHKEGHSIRQLARLTGNSRNTVRRICAVRGHLNFKLPSAAPSSMLFETTCGSVTRRADSPPCGFWRKSARWALLAPSIFCGVTSPRYRPRARRRPSSRCGMKPRRVSRPRRTGSTAAGLPRARVCSSRSTPSSWSCRFRG